MAVGLRQERKPRGSRAGRERKLDGETEESRIDGFYLRGIPRLLGNSDLGTLSIRMMVSLESWMLAENLGRARAPVDIMAKLGSK